MRIEIALPQTSTSSGHPTKMCPDCGSRSVCTERRIGGNSKCENGHEHPTAKFMVEAKVDLEKDDDIVKKSTLGHCPICNAPGQMREKRPNGNDVCVKQHMYPSASALP